MVNWLRYICFKNCHIMYMYTLDPTVASEDYNYNIIDLPEIVKI